MFAGSGNVAGFRVSGAIDVLRSEGFRGEGEFLRIGREAAKQEVEGGGAAAWGEFAFPDNEDPPAELPPLLLVEAIALHVPTELFGPKAPVARGDGGRPASRMPMPEASADLDERPVAWENNVGMSGQGRHVEAEAVPVAVQPRTDQHFRLGVLGANARHEPATAFWR